MEWYNLSSLAGREPTTEQIVVNLLSMRMINFWFNVESLWYRQSRFLSHIVSTAEWSTLMAPSILSWVIWEFLLSCLIRKSYLVLTDLPVIQGSHFNSILLHIVSLLRCQKKGGWNRRQVIWKYCSYLRFNGLKDNYTIIIHNYTVANIIESLSSLL